MLVHLVIKQFNNKKKKKGLSKIDDVLLWAKNFGSQITHLMSYKMEWSHSIA
jgi:hypothetical protein